MSPREQRRSVRPTARPLEHRHRDRDRHNLDHCNRQQRVPIRGTSGDWAGDGGWRGGGGGWLGG